MNASSGKATSKSIVFGATGLVGRYIVDRLRLAGEVPFAVSRVSHRADDVEWLVADLETPQTIQLPPFSTLYCTADAILLARALPNLFSPPLKRIVAFSSTSVLTKLNSEIVPERQMLERLADAERKIVTACEQRNVEWTILRPTLIYDEGRDINISPLARLIKRFGFMPLAGPATGLRQPVHAEDLAIGAIAAASTPLAANKFYSLPGGETLTYREMIGRIFDGLRRRRRTISVPVPFWKAAFAVAKPLFPDANSAMGPRMNKNMIFDATPAARDLNWRPRAFHPKFE